MLHREFDAPEELRDSIKCFWYNRRDYGVETSEFEVVPDGYAEIIFHFGSGCNVLQNGLLQSLPSPFIMGLLNRPVRFAAKDQLEILGVRCFPWTVFDLLGLPPGRDGLRLFEHPVAALQPLLETLVGQGKSEQAVEELQEYFLSLRSQVAADSMLAKAGLAMQKAGGNLPVSGVAAAAHATVRTLERKFLQSSGYSVKDVSGLMRFEQARNRLWMEPETALAGLAAELGYTDQSHLSREFKRYSGTTPGAFARKTKQRRQSLGSDFVAFVQS